MFESCFYGTGMVRKRHGHGSRTGRVRLEYADSTVVTKLDSFSFLEIGLKYMCVKKGYPTVLLMANWLSLLPEHF